MLRAWRPWRRSSSSHRPISISAASRCSVGEPASSATPASSTPLPLLPPRPSPGSARAQFRTLLASASNGDHVAGLDYDGSDAVSVQSTALQLRYAARPVVRVEGSVAGRPLSLEVGRIGPLADAVVRAQYGGTCVLVSAVSKWALAPGAGAGGGLPLQVDYREKAFGAGAIPGSATRREPGTSDRETLAARAVDRALRPLFPRGYAFDTQVLVTVLAFDTDADPVMLAITAASAALHVSDIPWAGPAAAVRVGWLGAAGSDVGRPVLAPSAADAAHSALDLLYAAGGGGSSVTCGGGGRGGGGDGGGDAAPPPPPPPRPHRTLMLELGAAQLPEAQLVAALRFADDAAAPLLRLQDDLRRLAGRPKRSVAMPLPSPATMAAVRELLLDDARAMYRMHGFRKAQRGNAQRLLALRVSEELAPRLGAAEQRTLGAAVDAVVKEALRGLVHDAVAAEAAALTDGGGEDVTASPRGVNIVAAIGARITGRVDPLTGVPCAPPATDRRQAGAAAVSSAGDGAQPLAAAGEVIEAERSGVGAAEADDDDSTRLRAAAEAGPLLLARPSTGPIDAASQLAPVDAARCRPDGRSTTDIRRITGDVDVLPPPVHGSALFARGDTQVLCTVTLGPTDRALEPRSAATAPSVAAAAPRPRKHFFLHYDFPPYSTNETGRVGGAALNRRMVGHGALAERALAAVMPAAVAPHAHAAAGDRPLLAKAAPVGGAEGAPPPPPLFPYAVRVTSEVTGSDGSSSMATVCGACLALFDAGVPLSDAVAGISVGVFGPRTGGTPPIRDSPAADAAAATVAVDEGSPGAGADGLVAGGAAAVVPAAVPAAEVAAATAADAVPIAVHDVADAAATAAAGAEVTALRPEGLIATADPSSTRSASGTDGGGAEDSSLPSLPLSKDAEPAVATAAAAIAAAATAVAAPRVPSFDHPTTSTSSPPPPPVDAPTPPTPDGYDTPGGRYVLLTDIFGLEDHAGDCDFKVAGSRRGVTAAQLDVKPAGLPLAVLEQALWRARDARLRVLDAMAAVLPAPRAALKPCAPLVAQLELAPEGVSLLLAGGGGALRRVAEATGAVLSLDQERGPVPLLSVYAPADALSTARRLLGAALEDHARLAGSPFAAVVPAGAPPLLVGDVLTATVSSALEFGAVLSVGAHEVGWLHASELTDRRRVRVSDVLTPGDAITAQVVDIDARGRAKFSVRSLLRRDGGPSYVEAPDDYERLVVQRKRGEAAAAAVPAASVSAEPAAAPAPPAPHAADTPPPLLRVAPSGAVVAPLMAAAARPLAASSSRRHGAGNNHADEGGSSGGGGGGGANAATDVPMREGAPSEPGSQQQRTLQRPVSEGSPAAASSSQRRDGSMARRGAARLPDSRPASVAPPRSRPAALLQLPPVLEPASRGGEAAVVGTAADAGAGRGGDYAFATAANDDEEPPAVDVATDGALGLQAMEERALAGRVGGGAGVDGGTVPARDAAQPPRLAAAAAARMLHAPPAAGPAAAAWYFYLLPGVRARAAKART